jgi:hypothetical protein
MAITEDPDSPRLTPSDDRLPSGHRLLRTPGELSDDQFDLLAACWSEGALDGDALEELESVFSASPGRKERAESFRQIRLKPVDEHWQGMNASLRHSTSVISARRAVIPALLAAAAVILLVIYGPAAAKLKIMTGKPIPEISSMTVAEIPASRPISRWNGSDEVTGGQSALTAGMEDGGTAPHKNVVAVSATTAGGQASGPEITDRRAALAVQTGISREMPLATVDRFAVISAVAPATDRNLTAMNIMPVISSAGPEKDTNWMLRSISFLAGAITGKEKEIDGFVIASGCINGLNTILGWDMELEQVSNRSGNTVAVSFSSNLFSFTKPLNKTTP